ncbi:MAG TPA: DUF4268 domain-containing protein [Phycisphaerae bacterium]|nr:DUF4268 domain-containing protein [Phycisphaerae bacterium]HOQ87078.1 DUF4268 domain-containing protein [Phycisphaerae bacterium]
MQKLFSTTNMPRSTTPHWKPSDPAIEKEMGEPLTWHNPRDKQMCRIWTRHKCNLENRDRWPEQQKWLLEKLERMHAVFGPRMRELKLQMEEETASQL